MASCACAAIGVGRVGVIALCLAVSTAAAASAQSVLDGFDPGANAEVRTITVQPDGRILVGGFFTALGGGGFGVTARHHVGRLTNDGAVDAAFNPGANGAVYSFALQPDGKIVVAGLFTMIGGGGAGNTPRQYLARLNADGTLDASFAPGANGPVTAVALQADGKIVVGGEFSMLGGGGSGTTPRSRIGRLNSDGSLDTGFNPGANGPVNALAVQRDGKVVLGGTFTTLGGGGTGAVARSRLARLNRDGSVDAGFDPGASDAVHAVVIQPDGKILVGGAFLSAGGGGAGTTARHRIARLNVDGSLDFGFDPGADGTIFTVALQADARILVGGSFTGLGNRTGATPRSNIGRLQANGTLVDPDFNPGADFEVRALAVQMDAKILVGGAFSRLGEAALITRNYIGRLYPGGTLDSTLNPGVSGILPPFRTYVGALAVQPDGKVVIGGLFSTVGGSGGVAVRTRNNIARLNADGSIEDGFDPGANLDVSSVVTLPDGKILVGGGFNRIGGGGFGSVPRTGLARLNPDGSVDLSFAPGLDAAVTAIVAQPDGKILIAGAFSTVGGVPRPGLARLHPEGTLDTSFAPGSYPSIAAIALQPDGKVVIGGFFFAANFRNHIARLEADGSLDNGFNPGAGGFVAALLVQPDGKILVGGGFSGLGGGTGTVPRVGIGRLHPDGAVDAGFNPGTSTGGIVTTLALQVNGQIVVGGTFTGLGGGNGATPRRNIGRINADGSVDAAFNPGANGSVDGLAIQPDTKIIAGGQFDAFGGGGAGGFPRRALARLAPSGAMVQSLEVSILGDTIAWLRSGSGPEVEGVVFEQSSTGTGFTPVGNAARVPGGWQLAGLNLPRHQNLYIRARAYSVTGETTSSGNAIAAVRNVFVAPLPPDTTTLGVSSITATGALLTAEVNPYGLETTARFEYGPTPAYGFTTPAQSVGSGVAHIHFAAPVTGLTCRTTYHFRVTASNVIGTSPGANATFTTPTVCTFIDDPLIPGVTIVKAIHVLELRARTDALRAGLKLPPFLWTDATLTAGATIIRVQHILELRSALTEVYVASARPAPVFDPTLSAGAAIRVNHLTELRTAIQAIE